jgi:hypothetical protein
VLNLRCLSAAIAYFSSTFIPLLPESPQSSKIPHLASHPSRIYYRKLRLAVPVEQKEIMKKITFGILPLVASGSLLLSGCISHHHAEYVTTEPVTTRTVVVTEAPPPPQTEVEGNPPAESDVWVAGYWTHVDDRWVWMPGHWEARPHANAMWVPGHWDQNPDTKGYVWTPGYWQ